MHRRCLRRVVLNRASGETLWVVSGGNTGSLQIPGSVDLTVRANMSLGDPTGLFDGYLVSAQTSDGDYSIRADAASTGIVSKALVSVRGVDLGYAYIFYPGPTADSEYEVRHIYDAQTFQDNLFWVRCNGVTNNVSGGGFAGPTGPRLSDPAMVFEGSNRGSDPWPGDILLFQSEARPHGVWPVEFLCLSDYNFGCSYAPGAAGTAESIYTSDERWARPGIGVMGQGNETLVTSLGYWNYGYYAGNAALKAVIISTGMLDLYAGDSVATIVGNYQALVDKIKTDNPTTKVIGVQIPADLLASHVANWSAVNVAIAGGGGTPVTGLDAVVSSHMATISDGAGHLNVGYRFNGDSYVCNTAARTVVAGAVRAALVGLGLL